MQDEARVVDQAQGPAPIERRSSRPRRMALEDQTARQISLSKRPPLEKTDRGPERRLRIGCGAEPGVPGIVEPGARCKLLRYRKRPRDREQGTSQIGRE